MSSGNEQLLAATEVAQDNVAAFVEAGRNAEEAVAATRIEIEREMPSGFLHGRQDLWVRGRVVADEPVEQVSLRVGRDAVGNVFYGRSGTITAVKRADGSSARQYDFAFNLRRSAAEAELSCRFAIVARGEAWTASEDFVLASDSDGDMACRIVEGPTAVDAAHTCAPMVVYVERVSVAQNGQLHIEGWTLSVSPIVTVQIFSDEGRIGVAQLGRARADVAKTYPDYPNAASSGFVFRARLDPEWHRISRVRVEAVSHDGTTQEAFCTVMPAQPPGPARVAERTPPSGPTLDGRREIRMSIDDATLDEVGQLAVNGWALSAVGIARVEVRLDGEPVGEAEVALLREDVAEAHPASPMARFAGFRFVGTIAQTAGNPQHVTVTAVNGLDDRRDETAPVRTGLADVRLGEVALSATNADFRLEIDNPMVVDGAVARVVFGILTIEGWALARPEVVEVAIAVDGQPKGRAHYGFPRSDVATAFPEHENALRSGFKFRCPLRGLASGPHTVQLRATAADGRVAVQQFRITVQEDVVVPSYAQIRRTLHPAHARLYADLLQAAPARPRFVLLLRLTAGTTAAELAATLRSLAGQVCQDWRLHALAEDDDAATLLDTLLADGFAALSDRVEVLDSKATRLVKPDMHLFVGCLSPGDELGCDALAEMALLGLRHPKADVLYADEQRISPATGAREAFFKPAWSPHLLLSTNYIGRPWFVAARLLDRAGIGPGLLATEGEYGLLLRCTEQAQRIERVARLLCQRGRAVLDAEGQERAALAAAGARRGLATEPLPGRVDRSWRLRGAHANPRVSIIIPTRASNGYIKTCIETLRSRTTYPSYEIVCIDNIPDSEPEWKSWLRENADQIVHIPGTFNWSRFNNLAARQANGDYLLFLNDDIEIIQDDWLDAMMDLATRPEVGVVGPQLQFPNRTVQHAGVYLKGYIEGGARHAFEMLEHDNPGYFGLALTQRNVIAVTGACMLVRRDAFDAIGGFDEAHDVINNDLDYCLRAHESGQSIVYTPYASLIHYEKASRGTLGEVFDAPRFYTRWKHLFALGDPYLNPRLTLDFGTREYQPDDYRPNIEPAEEIFVGHPIFDRAAIRRVLAIKLDHIGDFLTALPALRRLKQVFPHAELHVLASPGVRSIAAAEPAIDGFIDFQFFHARSELGPRDLTAADFHALEERLAPYGFDLAVDLRVHTDTRKVMLSIPAGLRAGYDHFGEFPFLDITLEWEKDAPLQRRRMHMSDLLLNLVETIATVSNPERGMRELPAGDPAGLLARLPARVQRLFARRVVAVHPGVGMANRQWPPEHFATLCDLLVAESGLNVVLIGGPDERDLAASVLRRVAHRKSVVSLAGQTALADLPLLLKACALYVGNNSGPKHLAASLGVPTIGIHSGVVDAVEWGPLGERAMAVQRSMQCRPCYLTKTEDCPRDMACLKQLTPAMVLQSCETLLGAGVARKARRRGK